MAIAAMSRGPIRTVAATVHSRWQTGWIPSLITGIVDQGQQLRHSAGVADFDGIIGMSGPGKESLLFSPEACGHEEAFCQARPQL